jgi:DNA-binding CsgD family transcriptional regulator
MDALIDAGINAGTNAGTNAITEAITDAVTDIQTKKFDDIDRQVKPEIQFGYYAELSASLDVADFQKRIGKIIHGFGFSEYTYSWLTQFTNLPPELGTLPTSLTNKYFDARLYEYDMGLLRAKEGSSPFFQSTIHDYIARAPFNSAMTRKMREITELNKSFGYYDYFITPVCKNNGSVQPVLSVTCRGLSSVELKSSVDGCESVLCLLAEAIDFVAEKFFPEIDRHTVSGKPSKAAINPKPLRVLDTLANSDLTINDVANQLSISVVTANQHLKTVRKALGVKTNYAAIKRAILDNLIDFEVNKK